MGLAFTVWSVGSFVSGIDPAWIALIGTLCGGIGLKVLEHWLGKSKEKNAEAAGARRDLTAEVKDLVDRVDKLESEVTQWRDRYYTEQEKRHLLRLQILEAGLIPADNITVTLTDDSGKATSTFNA